MQNYWIIELWDGEQIKVKPENAPLVQKKIATGEGSINTPDRTIIIKNIKDFRETTERYTDQKLIEAGAQAFNEPVIENDSVMCRMVKKSVTRREYTKHYAHLSAYRKIGEQDNYIVIMWLQPIHLIDYELVEEITQDDERRLAKKV